MSTTQDIESPISDYYAGRSIFITGGTGFMGKVLLEKLLRSCPEITYIYVLIRTKKGQCAQDRLQKLLEGRLFTPLTHTSPNALQKVVAISGDITAPKLGISPADMETIISNVSVIFHAAATVKFDGDLADSIKMNVKGTLSIVDLARRIDSLSSLVHVSTAYSHCYTSSSLEEKFYPMPENKWSSSSPDEIIEMCNEAKLRGRDMTKDIIGIFPNTYTFTKAMAEKVLEEKASDLPIAIIRPSIVTASWKEPIPGWVDNLNGPTGLLVAGGTGLMHTIYARTNKKADLMPVDVAINLLCVLAWKVGAKTYAPLRTNDIPIYNCTSGSSIPITWGRLEKMLLVHILKNPMENMLWYPSGSFKNHVYIDRICRIFVHWVPAYCIDAVIYIAGLKPKHLVKITHKMHKAMEALEYFATREWLWDTQNVQTLYDELSSGDQSLYNFSFRNFDSWNNYFEEYALGAREFVMKSNPNSLEACRKKMNYFYLMHQLFKIFTVIVLYLLFSWLWKLFSHYAT